MIVETCKDVQAIVFNICLTNLTVLLIAILQNLHFVNVLIRPVVYIMLCTKILLWWTIIWAFIRNLPVFAILKIPQSTAYIGLPWDHCRLRRMNNKDLTCLQQWNRNARLDLWNIEEVMVSYGTIFPLGDSSGSMNCTSKNGIPCMFISFVLHNSWFRQHPSCITFPFSSDSLEDRTNTCKSMFSFFFFFGLFSFTCSSFVIKSNTLTFWQLTLYFYGHKSIGWKRKKKSAFHYLLSRFASRKVNS